MYTEYILEFSPLKYHSWSSPTHATKTWEVTQYFVHLRTY